MHLVHKSCVIVVDGHELLADLHVLDMDDFDVILGMDWLSSYHAITDCYKKIVKLGLRGNKNLYFGVMEWFHRGLFRV